ncbi:hypothetical protein OG562_19560 [Streptomyces sp. NBC_01275]|uniref:hypothetical protein n=1 Tax=Streptomyces sp. NBC_01275 TaxID=2903807 RepID=UPI00224E8742|nr:hypothetical protein [Streptomyces sp. NBC_01275]MCX4763138.1 hypothetical protein [Streptomyces sp. NBC_01275]
MRKVRPGRIAAVAGAVLLAGALIGGVGYTVVTVQDADRAGGEPTWKFPSSDDGKSGQSEKGEKGAKSASGLSSLFVPFGTDGFDPGPDLEEFGSDADFNGAQANALRKESIKDLPSSTRKQLEKLYDKQRIQAMAIRSYAVSRLDYNITDAITVDATLTRLKNRTAVRETASSYNAFLADTDLFREGPKIAGHKDAHCFLTPKGEDEELGNAFCTASVGDVLVSVTANGPGPLDGAFVAKFFAAQLDRIDDPGQAV